MSVPQMLARMEHNIGWVFHSKLTAIEALNSAGQPINYDGQWHNLRRNDNLAIIGDKALDQVLSLMWYHSSNPQGLQSMSAKKNKMLMRPRRLFNQGSLVNSSTGLGSGSDDCGIGLPGEADPLGGSMLEKELGLE